MGEPQSWFRNNDNNKVANHRVTNHIGMTKLGIIELGIVKLESQVILERQDHIIKFENTELQSTELQVYRAGSH